MANIDIENPGADGPALGEALGNLVSNSTSSRTYFLNANASGTVNMNVASYRAFHYTLTGNVNLNIVGTPPGSNSSLYVSVICVLEQDNTAPHYFTPNASIRWAGGYAPSLMASNGGIDVFNFISFNGGNTWIGARTLQV